MSLLGWILAVALVAGAVHLVVSGARAVALAVQPLSGADTDAVVYHGSLLTIGTRDNTVLWVLIALDATLWWAWLSLDRAALAWPALGVFVAAAAWSFWTWTRVAASVKFLSWRQGWRHSARRVPTAQIAEVHVSESSLRLRVGGLPVSPPLCRLTVVLKDGASVKLPLTCAWTSLGEVEQVANFTRMQVDVADDAKRRVEQEKRHEARQQGRRVLTPEERALRKDLLALRKDAGDQPQDPDDRP